MIINGVNKLGTVGGGLRAIPLIIEDVYTIFQTTGTLIADVGNLNPASLTYQWSQLTGLPVTFNSPTDQQSVSVTSQNFDFVTLQCVVNAGEINQAIGSGTIFHFPIDQTANVNSVKSSVINTDLISNLKIEAIGGFHVLQGTYGSYGIGLTSVDPTTVVRNSNPPNTTIQKTVLSTKLEISSDGISWTEDSTFNGYTSQFETFTSAQYYRFRYEALRYGYIYSKVFQAPQTIKNGITDIPSISNTVKSSISNLLTDLQSIVKNNYSDSTYNTSTVKSSVSNLYTDIQSLISSNQQDSTRNYSAVKSNISNLVSSLQTQQGVT